MGTGTSTHQRTFLYIIQDLYKETHREGFIPLKHGKFLISFHPSRFPSGPFQGISLHSFDRFRLILRSPLAEKGPRPGDSLAVNGACLTVTEIGGGTLTFGLAPETLSRTNLGSLTSGDGKRPCP